MYDVFAEKTHVNINIKQLAYSGSWFFS